MHATVTTLANDNVRKEICQSTVNKSCMSITRHVPEWQDLIESRLIRFNCQLIQFPSSGDANLRADDPFGRQV